MANWGTAGTMAAVSVITPLVLRWLLRSGSVPEGRLAYTSRWKLFTLFLGLVPPALVAIGVAAQTRPLRPDEYWAVAGLLTMFPAIAAPLALETLRVCHRFDERGIDFVSPWSAHRHLDWASVTAVRWRASLKWLDLQGPEGTKVHLSPMLEGLAPFASLALKHLPAEVLAQSPEGRAVLVLMVHGHGSALLMAPQPPTVLASQAGLQH